MLAVGILGALHELEAADGHAPPPRPQQQPERRGGFSLAVAGVDDQQSVAALARGHVIGARSLLLRPRSLAARGAAGGLIRRGAWIGSAHSANVAISIADGPTPAETLSTSSYAGEYTNTYGGSSSGALPKKVW